MIGDTKEIKTSHGCWQGDLQEIVPEIIGHAYKLYMHRQKSQLENVTDPIV